MPAFIGGTGVAYPTSLTEIGIALELTKGTLAAAPTYMVPVKAPKYKPDQAYIPAETLQGSMVLIQDEVQGMRYDSHGWDAPPYLDSFPILVCAELGSSDTYGVAGSPTTLTIGGAAAGATTFTTAANLTTGNIVVLDSGNSNQETAIIKLASGATNTLLYPLVYSHSGYATVTPLNTHSFSVNNNKGQGQPPSCSIWDNDSEQWRTLTASQLDELTIKGNATGLTDYTTTWFTNAAATNAAAPVTGYTTVPTPPPWTTQCLLGSSGIQTVVDWSFNFKRGVKPIPALTGSTAYLEYFAGPLQSGAKITFVEQSSSPYLNDYLTGVKQALDIITFDRASGDLIQIHSSSALFTTGELDRSKEWCEVMCDVQLLPTSTDATQGGRSPVKITIANAVASAYWTWS